MAERIKRGDRFVFRMPAVPDQPVQIAVTRVARDGAWADIVCTPVEGKPWRKRQQLPMPEHITRIDERPVWLLDVDGVLNANNPGWSAAPRRRSVWSNTLSRDFTIRWAPALIARIRQIDRAGQVEIRWCTTWCGDTTDLETALSLPAFTPAWTDYRNGRAGSEAKLAAARAVLAEGRPLVWTDDHEVPYEDSALYAELTAAGRALLIRPDERRGLQPEHIAAIEAWVRELGGEAARVAPQNHSVDLVEPEGGETP